MSIKSRPQFNLASNVMNLDGDALSPGQLGVTPTKSELVTIPGEGGGDVQDTTPEYKEGPCPVWRAIKHALVAQEVVRNEETGAPVSVKKISEDDKARRYDLANHIVRGGAEGVEDIKLTDGQSCLKGETSDVELILERCSVVYGIEAFGFIRSLLNNPLEDDDENEPGKHKSE